MYACSCTGSICVHTKVESLRMWVHDHHCILILNDSIGKISLNNLKDTLEVSHFPLLDRATSYDCSGVSYNGNVFGCGGVIG